MRRLRRSPMAIVGGLVLLVVVLASVGAPLLTPTDPVKPSFGKRLQPPGGLGGPSAYLLGTDNLGRDILARLLYGGRISLTLATSAVLLAAGAGVVVGLAAGVVGGRVDDLVMRLCDVQLAFPVIMLAIAIVAVVGTSPGALVGVLALSGWVLYARTVRSGPAPVRSTTPGGGYSTVGSVGPGTLSPPAPAGFAGGHEFGAAEMIVSRRCAATDRLPT